MRAFLVVLLMLASACELKENSPPPSQSEQSRAAEPRVVDTVYRVDTVTITEVDTVFVTDTIHDTVTVLASSPTKTGSKATSRTASKDAPVVVKKPVAVTKAPVDTRSLPAVSATKAPVKATTAATSSSAVSSTDLEYLRSRRLLIPVPGISLADVPNNFLEKRGSRQHSALDFMAPRGTPVVSTDAGTVEKIHTSVGGGLTLYLADPRGQFIYYYAHLDRYRAGIKEGERVNAGDVIGYVGSTGNAVANAPHLHFAIGKMDAEKRWWKTTAIDPKPLMARAPAKVTR